MVRLELEMGIFFIWTSAFAFLMAIIWLVVSAVALFKLIERVMPLLTETKDNIRDLGDLSANTVGRASDTMDLVELRVTQAMGNAAEAGTSVTKQVLGLGTILASAYMGVRIIGMLRTQLQGNKRRDNPRRGKSKQ